MPNQLSWLAERGRSGGLAGGSGAGAAGADAAPLAGGAAGAIGDASRMPEAMLVATVVGNADRLAEALQRGDLDRIDLAGSDQIGEVVVRLRVGDGAGKKGVGRVVGVRLVGREKGRQARLGQRHRPRFAEVVGAAVARVLAQDQAGPVERAGQDPRRLRARALGRLDLHGAPLLPDHRRGERGDQGDDDHRREQGRTGLGASR